MPPGHCLSPRGPPEHPCSGEGNDPAPPFPPDGGARGWTCCEAWNGRTRRWPPGLLRRRQEMVGGSSPTPPQHRPERRTTLAAMLDGRARGTSSCARSSGEHRHRAGRNGREAAASRCFGRLSVSPLTHRRNGQGEQEEE
jgi:hypothetical protein